MHRGPQDSCFSSMTTLRWGRTRFLLACLSVAFLTLAACPACSSDETVIPDDPEYTGPGCLRQVNENGFGETLNRYVWSLAVFKDWLYAGTKNEFYLRFFVGEPLGTGGEIWRYNGSLWQKVVDKGLHGNDDQRGVRGLIVYEDRLYAGTTGKYSGGDACEIWRTSDGTTWNVFMEGGFGSPYNIAIRGVVVYKGVLYFGTRNPTEGAEIHAWNGSSWTLVADAGIGNPGNEAVSDMVVWNDTLYVLTWNKDGFEIYTYEGPGSSFDCIVGLGAPIEPGFGKPHNVGAMCAYVYNDRFYLGTGNYVTGTDLLRTDDGVTWTVLAEDGFGDPLQKYLWSMMEYKGDLYLGTYREPEWIGLDQIPGGTVYRMDKAENLVQIVGTNGLLMGEGFDNPHNWGIRSMALYHDKLFMGTAQNYLWDVFATGAQVWELNRSAECEW